MAVADGGSHEDALLVTGEPGIGKTTLLDVARHAAEDRGALVVGVTGVAVEAHLPFAALQRLVQPLGRFLPGLADPQRTALLRAVGDAGPEGPAPTLFALGLALLELVGRAARVQPVALVVDDAQWLDPPTTEVLGFLGRRSDLFAHLHQGLGMTRLNAFASLLVDEDVVQHRHHPGAQVGVRPRRLARFQGPHQRIVHEVIGPQRVAR